MRERRPRCCRTLLRPIGAHARAPLHQDGRTGCGLAPGGLQPFTALAYAHRCTEWRRRAMHARSPTCTHARTHARTGARGRARTHTQDSPQRLGPRRPANKHTHKTARVRALQYHRSALARHWHWPGTGPAWHWPVCSTTDRRCRPARRCASSTASPPRRAPPPVAAPRPRRLPFSHSAVIAPARRACHCAAALRHKPRGDRLSDQRRRWYIHRAAHALGGARAAGACVEARG
jgi:hypothetical protein